jgi:tellurite resistance protein TerC
MLSRAGNESMQDMTVPTWAWLILAGVMLGGLLVDLLAHRGNRGQGRKSAVLWSLVWIGLSLAFAGWVALQFGYGAAEDFVTAYVLEKSLSIDNLFVFLIIFSRLKIPRAEQHRVLLWGILGAFVTRAAFIAAGAALLSTWHEVVYVLGAVLIYTGIKTARDHANEDEAEGEGKILPFIRRHLPFTPRLDGHRFFTLENGRRVATPLLLALIVVEITDVIFAVDSIPAVFSITEQPFIVYSSNVFAILGLRALYLVLADLLSDLKYLRFGLAAILVLAGAKMLTSHFFQIPHAIALLAVLAILAASIAPSVVAKRRKARAERLGY